VSATIEASAVHLVRAGTPGAQRFKTGNASVGAYGGSIELLPAADDVRVGDLLTVADDDADKILELLKANQDGGWVWLLIDQPQKGEAQGV